jgi:hypothetical protein
MGDHAGQPARCGARGLSSSLFTGSTEHAAKKAAQTSTTT